MITAGCTNPSAKDLQKIVENNPEIVFNAIKKHPKKFLDTVNAAAEEARKQSRADAEKAEKEAIEKEFANPKTPTIEKDRVIFGDKNAPITIVEYSDFQCPYCSRGYETVKKVMKEYGKKVRVVYKHLPLSFHEEARPAAEYFEAIAMQSASKAEKFHDAIFENQQGLNSGKMKFLDRMAKKVGANMSKLKKALKSAKIKKRIDADIAEAQKFQFSGTPGFLINGVSLKGAYPFEEFKKVIDRHLETKKN